VAEGEQIINVRLDIGGVDGLFGFYTLNESDRSVYSSMRWSDYPPGTASAAGLFFDRAEAPQQLVPLKPPVLRDLSLTQGVNPNNPDGTASCSGCYGIVQEGSAISVVFNGCTTSPIAWVTGVNSGGAITSLAVGSGGTCSNPMSVTATITGAPTAYPWGTTTDGVATCPSASCVLNFSGNSLISITVVNPLTSTVPFPTVLTSSGMILENVNLFPSLGTSGNFSIQEGMWIEGVTNPFIGHFHCTGTLLYCEHYGFGQPVAGGSLITHDSLIGAANGLVDLGVGIDNNQTLISMMAVNGNIIKDEKNGFTLASSSTNEVGQYFPQGLGLYSHLNNPQSSPDIAGRCTVGGSCSTITFSVPYKNPPVCTASDESRVAAIRAMPTSTNITFSGGSSGDSIAYQCQGNPN
jgi:hypothetical protein